MFDQFQAVFKSLNEHRVRYVVIGGVAAIAHGSDRNTFDLDILIAPTLDNARRLLDAFAAVQLGTAFLTSPENVLANEITKFRDWVVIDVQTSTPGIEFDQAWSRRLEREAKGIVIPYLSLDDLLSSKRAAGRPKDLADIAFLTADRPNDQSGE